MHKLHKMVIHTMIRDLHTQSEFIIVQCAMCIHNPRVFHTTPVHYKFKVLNNTTSTSFVCTHNYKHQLIVLYTHDSKLCEAVAQISIDEVKRHYWIYWDWSWIRYHKFSYDYLWEASRHDLPFWLTVIDLLTEIIIAKLIFTNFHDDETNFLHYQVFHLVLKPNM